VGVRGGLGWVTMGVLAGQLIAPAWPLPRLVPAALALLAVAAWGVRGRLREPCIVVAVTLTAAAVGARQMDSLLVPQLPVTHVARLALPLRTAFVGRIVAPPERNLQRTALTVAAETVGEGTARRGVTGLVRVTVRHPRRHWRYGERVAVRTVLRRPRNFDNPGSFDMVGALARRRIYVTAAAWDAQAIDHLPGGGGGWRVRLERWRARLVTAIGRAVPAPEGALLTALVVGDEGGVDPATREAFTRAGVVHVLSVSGLHIALVASGAYVVCWWLLSRSELLLLSLDAQRLAALMSLVPVALYAALAGLQTPTLRSAIMVGTAVAAGLLGRPVDVLRTLGLAALAIALGVPGAPREISFQLSFMSVLAIVLGTRRRERHVERRRANGRRWRAWVGTALRVSLVALAGTAPLTALYFHQISLAAVIANPITVPIFGAAVVGAGLVGALVEPWVPGVSVLAFRAAGLVLHLGVMLVRFFAAPRWAAIDVPIPNLVELSLLYVLLGGLVLLPARLARVAVVLAGAALLADTAYWFHLRHASARLRVTFLDVGQGDAIVAELPGGRTLVVDAGGFPGSDFDTGAAVVGPFLYTRKVLRLDAIAMTHAHPDHAGGIAYLLTHFRPREFWWTGVPGTGREWEHLSAAIAASGARVRVLRTGDRFPWGEDPGQVLHPPRGTHALSLNDSSLTLRLGLGRAGVLLTGDIEAGAEKSLTQLPGSLASTVLKVPHHGSRTSSSEGFVRAVAPRIAVVSVGADNRYGLPAPEVEARLRAAGACVLRTDRCGAVWVESDGRTVQVAASRGGCTCAPVDLAPSAR
jgi:competence protein ComEC